MALTKVRATSLVRMGVVAGLTLIVGALETAAPLGAQAPAATPSAMTFTKDIAPILQRSCQNCHRPNNVAPMSLLTYEDVRPWARAIKQRTGIGPRSGVMPPWFLDRTIGIQEFKYDTSLSAESIAKIAAWVDAGAPRGNPADLPPALTFDDETVWKIGQPDLILTTPAVEMKASSPDWWGPIGEVPTGLTEDRYVAAVEYKEVTEILDTDTARSTVGGRYIFHHLCWGASTGTDGAEGPQEGFPCHEVGRNVDVFNPELPRVLKAGSKLVLRSSHLHSNGKNTKAYIQVGFKLKPKDFRPTKQVRRLSNWGGSMNLDIRPNDANQRFEGFVVLEDNAKIVTFEPHMHAAGVRMCLDAIYGAGMSTETLNCVGYDHSWVRVYSYADDAAPLLPKGTILRITGTFDNSPSNRNVADPRNWSGMGHRSIDNMMNNLGEIVYLPDEDFQAEMAKRRSALRLKTGQSALGCPLCGAPAPRMSTQGNNQ